MSFRFNTRGAERFAKLTRDNVGKPFAIILDDIVVSYPRINEPILGGSGQISGNFTVEETNNLAVVLRSGALPAKLTIVEERTVGPSLGSDSIRAGLIARLWARAGLAFMIVAYGLFGIFANIALWRTCWPHRADVVFRITLTLPGIAGIVLTMGMAVDSNVLIFERIREEWRNGRSALNAIETGFRAALGTIWDANLTTLVAALACSAWLRPDPRLRGDAVHRHPHHHVHGLHLTQLIVAYWVKCAVPRRFRSEAELSSMKPIRFIPDDTKIPFMKFSRFGYFLSGILMSASLLLFVLVGVNLGVDFKGGTVITIRTEQAANLDQLRSTINGLGLGSAELQEFGSPNDVLIRIGTQEGGDAAQQAAVNKIKERSAGSITAVWRLSVPRSRASWRRRHLAVVIALGLVLIYVWFRFEWQFALGAIASLMHDVILTVGLFCVLGLEFNLSIIAAILTIIGYSLNDTVVLFDRVREFLRKYKSMGFADLLDFSINSVLPRTLMTSVSVLLALLALYIYGGEVISGFTFTMIWGVIVGTYSSFFIAVPVLMLLGTPRDASKAEKAAAAAARP